MSGESAQRPGFADLEPPFCDYDASGVVVLPVPLERSTSYGAGTADGPRAILEASRQVELYDQELDSEPYRVGIYTSSSIAVEELTHAQSLEIVENEVRNHLGAEKFVLTLGGEHSLSAAPVRAAKAIFGELGVVQFDAHADLRASYQGERLSHACVMRRILEQGLPTLAVGIRSLSAPEAALIEQTGLAVIWAHELTDLTPERFRRWLEALPDRVYLTFDVDYFDPSLLPATGTPEPGGGEWYATLALLRTLFTTKRVVAMDLVELSPIAGQPASDFVAARLAYKCIAYLDASSGSR